MSPLFIFCHFMVKQCNADVDTSADMQAGVVCLPHPNASIHRTGGTSGCVAWAYVTRRARLVQIPPKSRLTNILRLC